MLKQFKSNCIFDWIKIKHNENVVANPGFLKGVSVWQKYPQNKPLKMPAWYELKTKNK